MYCPKLISDMKGLEKPKHWFSISINMNSLLSKQQQVLFRVLLLCGATQNKDGWYSAKESQDMRRILTVDQRDLTTWNVEEDPGKIRCQESLLC